MAGILITSLLSLATKLLPSIRDSAQASSSSSSSNDNNSEKGRARAVEEELERLVRTLNRIKATLYDAEEREIRDRSVNLWLKELKKVTYDAEDVLGEYRYEVLRVQVEERKAFQDSGSHKRKQMEYIVSIPDGMVDRLNKIRSQFDEIAKDREALQLRESDGVRRPNYKIVRPPTGHMVDETSIFGRDAEKEEVIDLLLSEKEKSFSVISIVGKGGLGKTTIAQLVYKDERVSRCFDLFGWVCVSEQFDVRRLIKATIESVSKTNYSLNELSPLQEELAKTMKGETILLVLDDVWNEDRSLWELFRVPFNEAKLVRILVTTRNKKVAEVMQTTVCFRPTNLPEDLSWQLFHHYAFSGTNDNVSKHLVDLGREIMRKCGGLPLVVKSIASLLRHETYEEGWREILESDLWESNSTKDIFPALQISYAHLPPHLKPCFLFCSMYPKDYPLEKMRLIEVWISHGYIEPKGKRGITEIGVEYYEELEQRSFLDDCSDFYLETTCKLHDIIHDLARLNSENEHYSMDFNQPLNIREGNVLRETYHLYVGGFMGCENQILQQNLKGLRTLSMDLTTRYEFQSWRGIAIHDFTKFEALRVLQLELPWGALIKIPDSIFELKHLAYLSITDSNLKMLPPLSIGLLYNLQTLILYCRSLEYLPESIGDLLNLHYLSISSSNLTMLPLSIGLLYNLQTLILDCSFLENLLPESIGDLINLHYLSITSSHLTMLPLSIGLLYNLQTLILDCSSLEYLPESIGDLLNLQFLKIKSSKVKKLPKSLGSLSNLLRLVIIGNQFLDYVPHGLVNFPAIKTMKARLRVRTVAWLKDMTDLEGTLSIYGVSNLVDAQRANMRNKCKLETLDLSWDPKSHLSDEETAESELILRLIPETCEDGWVDVVDKFSWLEYLQPHPNLKKLQVKSYSPATVPRWMMDPSSLQSIQEVWLEECYNIQSLPFNNLHTLKHLTINYCVSIQVLQLEQLPSQLKKLSIRSCDSIQVLQLEQLPSQLEELNIGGCDHLDLITGLGNLNMLATLRISFCRVLKSIRMDGLQLVESTEPIIGDSSKENPHIGQQSISSLTTLKIEDCDLLCVLPDGLIPSGPCCLVRVQSCGCPDLQIGHTLELLFDDVFLSHI